MKQKTSSPIRVRLLKGLGAQGFSQVVQIFIRLAEVPLLLSFWGTQLYGEWLMLSAIPAYLCVGDGGFSGAACRKMTILSGSGNRNRTLAVFQSTWVLLIVISLATGFLAYSFVNVAPLEKWLNFSSMTALEVKLTLLIFVLYVLTGFQGGLLNGVYWVAGRYSTGMYLVAITQLLEFAGLSATVALGGGPVEVAFGYLCGRLIGTGLMWIGQLRVSPWLRHGISYVSFKEIRCLTIPAFASLAFPLGHALNIHGIRLVVGIVLSPSAVAVFVPLRTLSRLVMQPTNMINRILEPELALAYGSGNMSRFRHFFLKSCQLALWGCIVVSLFVGPAAAWIVPVWTNFKVMINWPTFLILLAGVITNSIWYTALMVPYAINRHGRIALIYILVYGVASLMIAYLASFFLGLLGVALTLLIVEAAMVGIVLKVSLKMTKVKISQWGKSVFDPPFEFFGHTVLFMRNLISTTSE